MKRRHLRAKLKTNCSALFIFVLWLSLWLTSGCQKKHEQGKDNVLQQSIPSVSPNTSKALDALSRQELITALINRGDKSLSIDDTPAARWAYTLAILFDPANQTAMTTFMSISKAGTETNSDSDIRMADFVAVINEDTLIEGFMSEFPPITTVMEMVNLKMLFDERLTGNLEYSGMLLGFKDSKLSISPTRQYVPGKHKADEPNNERPVDTQLFFFMKKTSLTMTELRTAYGAPSTNRKSKAANEILTYGIFRFIGDSNGKIAGIIFPVGWECPSKADISEPHLLFGIWEYSTMVGLVKGTTYYTSGNIQGHLNLDANGQCQSEYSIGSDTTLEQEHGRYEIKGNQVLLKRNNGRPDSSLLAYGNTTGNKNITLLREQRGGGPEFIRYILRKK